MSLECLMNLPCWLTFPVLHALVLAVGGVMALGVVVWLLVRRKRSRAVSAHGMRVERLPETVTAEARELMDESDVTLLNLLMLVARDRFLVLAKVPLTRLLRLRVRDDFDAQIVAKAIRRITVDFVLLHPGTRRAARAVFVERPEARSSLWRERRLWLDMLFHEAEIEVIRLDRDGRYNVEHIADLLGITDDE